MFALTSAPIWNKASEAEHKQPSIILKKERVKEKKKEKKGEKGGQH